MSIKLYSNHLVSTRYIQALFHNDVSELDEYHTSLITEFIDSLPVGYTIKFTHDDDDDKILPYKLDDISRLTCDCVDIAIYV